MFLEGYQLEAVRNLRNGSILCGGVGTGKSRTALAYYFCKVLDGKLDPEYVPPTISVPLYIITTAKKRDSGEWPLECAPFFVDPESIDSWNNIDKYIDVEGGFFIFDEQRVVGSGLWAKSFIKIAKKNKWILLSATPGDTWMDYIPVFVANGFYKNRTAFIREHVIYNQHAKYPKIDKYVGCRKLVRYRDSILVDMDFTRKTKRHYISVKCDFSEKLFNLVKDKRWDPYENEPIQEVGKLYLLMRRVVNSDEDRLNAITEILDEHPKVILFYSFDYELEILKNFLDPLDITYAEYNGHKHQPIPETEDWVYLVQYRAGSEGWNCIETDTIIFYSLDYSYKVFEQASGRIDRMNTPYTDLYYYQLYSDSYIDRAIKRSLDLKEEFNQKKDFLQNLS